ncbi:hypothetical protein GD1_127 [Paraglaciecola Antarctic GD virus 1]|nr:hypothetical protein GD1_127 [Paraglaciecola Antarctic GD virus 1]
MTIAFDKKPENINISLDGATGNVFHLIAAAKNLCKQLGEDSVPIVKAMTSGDYIDAICAFELKFGRFVDLTTDDQDLIDMIHERSND